MIFDLHLHSSQDAYLVAYSDADWSGCSTRIARPQGIAVFLGNNLISWSSKQQATTSWSSTEAEYCAVANAIAKTTWVHNLLSKLLCRPFQDTIVIYCDNISIVYLSSNPV